MWVVPFVRTALSSSCFHLPYDKESVEIVDLGQGGGPLFLQSRSPPVDVPSASHKSRHRFGSLHFGDVSFGWGLGERWDGLESVDGRDVRRRGCVMLRGGRLRHRRRGH